MSTETLRPNATGDEEAIPNATSGATNHHLDVDEASPDGDTSIVYTDQGGNSWDRDLYNLPASSGLVVDSKLIYDDGEQILLF